MSRSTHPTRRVLHRGLSIIELMVGVTIGLFILAGATLVASTQLADNRRMLLETQIQQDLRATADVISRDLRMAGHWGTSWQNIWPTGGAPALGNPYTSIRATNTSINYERSTDETNESRGLRFGQDNQVIDSDERLGFRFNQTAKTIEMLVGANNWQTLTDPNVVEVTQFDITLSTQQVSAPCAADCAVGPAGCPLKLQIRDVLVAIGARAVHDNNIRRSVQSDVRLRNDVLAEVCP